MSYKVVVYFVLFFAGVNAVYALGPIDTFITSHCGDVCNGESDACRACYSSAVDLYDQAEPDDKWGYDHGKLEWEF